MLEIQDRSQELGFNFYVIGDTKTPADYSLPRARYTNVEAQLRSGLSYARLCPTRHYARKNIGYLMAMRDGAELITETDDDNIPSGGFLSVRERTPTLPLVRRQGWCNVYRYYSDELIWPRGLPLAHVRDDVDPFTALPSQKVNCPIQQGLADDNPDVDAIYRLVLPLPIKFTRERRLALDAGVWCPFNSQNTTFWRDAFPLMYLPANCSWRMCDIWRSFIAQRICWENDWKVEFHSPDLFQERNEHDLMVDFAEEVPGYLNNERIRKTLEDMNFTTGVGYLSDNLIKAYEALIALEVVGAAERALVVAWVEDLAKPNR